MKKQNLASSFDGLGLPEMTSTDIAALTGLSAPTIRAMARDSRFPRPINLTGGKTPILRWFRKDVEAWMKDRMAGSGYQPYRPKHME